MVFLKPDELYDASLAAVNISLLILFKAWLIVEEMTGHQLQLQSAYFILTLA